MGNTVNALLPWAVLLALLYFVLIRPQKKQEKAVQEMRRSIDVGDSITTIGGIVGRVIDVKDDDVIVVEVGAARTKIHFKRWAIQSKDTLSVAEKNKQAENTDVNKDEAK